MRRLWLVLALLALLVGGWWYASPYWTLHQMQSAAERGDTERLSRFIDYSAVRRNLKTQVRETVSAGAGAESGNGLAALGSAIATAMVDPLIDTMVTPQGLQAAFAHRNVIDSAVHARTLNAPERPVVAHQGLDQFTARDVDRDRGLLVFRRAGLGWRLVGFELPRAGAGA